MPIRRLTLLLILATALPAAADAVFHMVYADYRPYSWTYEGKATGLEVDVVNALLRDRLHLVVEHAILPWERAQQYVKTGKADAMIATTNAEREGYAWRSNSAVSYWQMSAFARRDDTRFRQGLDRIDALSGYELGSEMGNRWVGLHVPNAQIHYVESITQLPPMLLAHRIDLIADDAMVVRNLIAATADAEQIVELPLPGTRSPMYFMLSKQSGQADLLPKINAALDEMARDGTLLRIQQRYRQSQ